VKLSPISASGTSDYLAAVFNSKIDFDSDGSYEVANILVVLQA